MKKLKYTLIALLVLCMTGCNESSFLEEDPRASLYPENLLVRLQRVPIHGNQPLRNDA